MKKTGESVSGIFMIREYQLEDGPDFLPLLRRLQAGPGEVREVVTYVFGEEDPLGIDARSFSPEEFERMYPQMQAYGSELAFDFVVRTEGHPLTVEITMGDAAFTTSSVDRDLELEDLLGEPQLPKEPQARKETEEMTPAALLEILARAEKLKCNTRHCDTSSGRRESVAEHSWRAALTAMLLAGQEEFSGFDMDRVIRMCLIHDLGEAFTGDIPTFEKTEEDAKREESVLLDWIGAFPEPQREEFLALFREMRERRSPEARLFKAIDKLEAVIQHNESDISSWLPLEYELQMTYGQEEAREFPFLAALRERIDAWTQEKIAESRK